MYAMVNDKHLLTSRSSQPPAATDVGQRVRHYKSRNLYNEYTSLTYNREEFPLC